MMRRKKSGMKKMAIKVAASMPPITGQPRAWRLAAPAPLEVTSGTQPRMKASDVMAMGRKRSRAASNADSRRLIPSSCFITANSTMRMAFLAARPTSVTSPIWK
ncbi:hypothetical protein D3C85_1598890 [compost metagenome]